MRVTSRERLKAALNHQTPDRTPIDLGATAVSGMHALAVYRLRAALGLKEIPVRIWEVFQQLGWVEEDLLNAIGGDVIGVTPYTDFFGNRIGAFKPYPNDWGFKTQISGEFTYKDMPDGSRVVYPQADSSAPPTAEILKGGYFYNNLHHGTATCDEIRSGKDDFKDDFALLSDDAARHYEQTAKAMYENTNYGLIGLLGPAGFGDAALIPGSYLKNPQGIRNLEDWMMVHYTNPDYVHEVFAYQTEMALKNLEIYKQAVGDRIEAVYMGGTDFGTQIGTMISIDCFRDFYKPYWKIVNDWVHKNTGWKTFYHSCGAVRPFIEDFIEAGLDILNPVQCSATGMDAKELKDAYGECIVFWGGGIDTQKTLPFGTPEEVKQMVKERMEIFSKNGGYIFNPVHNVQANTPIENLVAMYKAAELYR